MRPRHLPAFLAAGLALASCAGGGPPPAAPPDGSPATPPAAPDAEGPSPGKDAPGFPAPERIEEGDRWFVAVRPASGRDPMAERHRRRRAGDLLREEVTWDRSFAALAAATHGTAQVFAVLLDGKGLSVALLDAEGRISGEPRLEVAAPFRVGTSWTVEGPGPAIEGRVEALEEVATPAGRVRALRVTHRGGGADPLAMTTWYDAGLRPVRSEIRRGGPKGEILEARAALASAEPSPEECRAAVEWARKAFGK